MRKSGGPRSEATKAKIAAAQLGKSKNWSVEGLARMKENLKLGAVKPEGFGDTIAAIWRKKNGGVPADPRLCREYLEWQEAVHSRDNHTCTRCGRARADGSYRLDAHHILPFEFFVEFRYEVSNGVTLCRPCHRVVENMVTRFLWVMVRELTTPEQIREGLKCLVKTNS